MQGTVYAGGEQILSLFFHTVSHLKGLTSAMERLSGHECGSTFTQHRTILKSTQFAS